MTYCRQPELKVGSGEETGQRNVFSVVEKSNFHVFWCMQLMTATYHKEALGKQATIESTIYWVVRKNVRSNDYQD